jgi:hypothetical protein
LYQRNPINDPTKAAIKLSFPRIRDIHNIQIIRKNYISRNEREKFPATLIPPKFQQNPSIPSVKLAPLDTHDGYKITAG